jgi:hypothetical protein
MNMGSSNNNIVSQLKATMQELRQGFSGMRQEMSGFFSVTNAASSMVGGHAGPVHTNQVAPNPVFNNAPSIIGMTESGNIVAAGPSASMTAGSGFSQQTLPGMENLSQYVSKNPGSGTVYTPASMVGGGGGAAGLVSQTAPYDAATGKAIDASLGIGGLISKLGTGLLTGAGIASSFLPGTDEVVQTNLLMKRLGFFTNGYQSKLLGTDSNGQALTAGGVANLLSSRGLATSALDPLNALAAGQSMGLMGGGSAFLSGVANVSNLTPGMGIEGAMRATGAMQQASSVNMLRGIGIQLRNADGTMAAPDKVIDDVWTKICKDFSQAYKGAKPTLEQVQIALQPGNSLDSMLEQYFGGDPMLKNMVMNGLLYRAQNAGALSTDAGINTNVTSTSAINALSAKYTATTGVLTSIADNGATGFTQATNIIKGIITDFSGLADATIRLKTFMDTLLSAAGGAPTEAIAGLASLLPGKATGGPVQGSTAYLVGERGPELFVPGVSGTIIPNDQIQPNQNKNSGTITGSSNNTYNFNINIPNANTPEVIGALRKLLSDLETNKIVSES